MGFRRRRHELSPAERAALTARLEALLRDVEGLACAYVHGSFAGDGPFGDVDVALLFQEGSAPRRPVDFELELEERLERALGYPVDVRVLNGAPLSFRYQVVRGGRPLAVRDDDARVAFQARVWSAYADFAPFRRRYLQEVLGDGAEPR